VLSLTSHFVEGCFPRPGASGLPIVLAIHAQEPVLISERATITDLLLFSTEDKNRSYGLGREAPWLPSLDVVELTPHRSLYLVHNLLECEDQPPIPGLYSLYSSVVVFVARTRREEYLRDDFRPLELRCSRNIEISR
jgi:hypothetical protein